MSNAVSNTNLIANEKALEAAGIAISLVVGVPAPLKRELRRHEWNK
jgi:hypothetical protein